MSQHTELIASLRAESDELIKYQFSHTKEAMSCLQRLHDLSLEAADALQALEPDDSGIVPDAAINLQQFLGMFRRDCKHLSACR